MVHIVLVARHETDSTDDTHGNTGSGKALLTSVVGKLVHEAVRCRVGGLL